MSTRSPSDPSGATSPTTDFGSGALLTATVLLVIGLGAAISVDVVRAGPLDPVRRPP